MKAREKLFKRKPVLVGDEDSGVYVRALTIRETIEAERLGKVPDGHQEFAQYVLSRAVVDESGEEVFDGPADESILEVPTDKLADILEALTKRSKVGTLRSTEKNSDATP